MIDSSKSTLLSKLTCININNIITIIMIIMIIIIIIIITTIIINRNYLAPITIKA